MSVFRASNSPETDWSVPVQRGPYPSGHPDPDGPTERLYVPEDEPEPLAEPDGPEPEDPELRRHRALRYAVVAASVALVVSAAAFWIALHALDRADAAGPAMTMHMPAPTPVQAPPAITPTPSAPTPSAPTPSTPAPSTPAPSTPAPSTPAPSSSTPSTPTPSSPATSQSPIRYAQEPVRIDAPCGTEVLLDLDQDERPRIDPPEQQADLRYDNRCGGSGALLSSGPGALAASHHTDPDTDRRGCTRAITERPLEPGDSVPAQRGAVLCVATATSLAVVEVTGLGDEGAVSLRATAWTAPDPARPSQSPGPAGGGSAGPAGGGSAGPSSSGSAGLGNSGSVSPAAGGD